MSSNLQVRILRVNLSTGHIAKEILSENIGQFIGGRGLNTWLLYQGVKPEVKALSPQNLLILGAGPLVGTLLPASSRLSIDAKSPVTGGIGSSNVGGDFGPELRYAGYDHLIIEGRSETPVVIVIKDNQVEIRDGNDLWGLTVSETERYLHKWDEGLQIACIGPAGENLVPSASIIVGLERAAGRCGLGAVMGSKNLKAIAVKGSGTVSIPNETEFLDKARVFWKTVDKAASTSRRRQEGTISAVILTNEACCMPVRNYQNDYQNTSKLAGFVPADFLANYEDGKMACSNCPIHCSHYLKVKEGPYAGLQTQGIKANTVWDWAGRLDIEYPPAVIMAHYLCNENGLDIDSTSCAIAWAFECYEKGLIGPRDTGGISLKWGDHETVLLLLKMIARREGFGNLLAEGSKKAAELIGRGTEQYAVHIKGQDLMEPMRGSKAWALGIAVSPRGGSHTRGAPVYEFRPGLAPETGLAKFDCATLGEPDAYTGKAAAVHFFERLQAIVDSLGICLFTSQWSGIDLFGFEELADLYNLVSGESLSGNDLRTIGERLHNIEKAFNILHAGFARADDYPPARFMTEPIKSGPRQGAIIHKDGWELMLDEYYLRHGWDVESGWPSRESLVRLGLDSIAEDFARLGKLRR